MSRHFTYDADKVKELRMSIIEAALKVMKDSKEVKRWSNYKKELILKMSARVLPQLNAGREDDEQLFPVPIYGGTAPKNKGHNSN